MQIASVQNFRKHWSSIISARPALIAFVGMLAVIAGAWQPAALLLLIPLAVFAYPAVQPRPLLQAGTRQKLEHLADAIDLRDSNTGGHSRRVAAFSEGILHTLAVSGPEADLIVLAARIHDIGKIGIPDLVLHKPGQLTSEEAVLMRRHPDKGADLLLGYEDFAAGIEIIRHHHEAWDGGGYPAGLRGTQTPFGARVIAVADSFDAMTSDRPYRRATTRAEATAILRAGRGKQWDPHVVDAFLHSIGAPAATPAPLLQVLPDAVPIAEPPPVRLSA